jgi:hypothetical protein
MLRFNLDKSFFNDIAYIIDILLTNYLIKSLLR